MAVIQEKTEDTEHEVAAEEPAHSHAHVSNETVSNATAFFCIYGPSQQSVQQ